MKLSKARGTAIVVALTLAVPVGVSAFVQSYAAHDAQYASSFAVGGGTSENPMVAGVQAGGLALVASFLVLFLLMEGITALWRRRQAGKAGPEAMQNDGPTDARE